VGRQLLGYYDSGKYVTPSLDNITYISSTDLVDMIQWHFDLSIGEEVSSKGQVTEETLISYQMEQ